MNRPIGYYVHHQGHGHLQRAMLIAQQARDRFVLIGTGLAGRCPGFAYLDLPDDRLDRGFDGVDDVSARPSALHYAPLDHDGMRRRTALITDWIAINRPALMVVDVSVEVAMLARLTSTPTVYVRLSGRRDDSPHLEAFRGARLVMSPFDRRLDDPDSAQWVAAKTIFCPGLTPAAPMVAPEADLVVVVVGKGGAPGDGNRLAVAARATPHRRWRVIGTTTTPVCVPPNLDLCGWLENAAEEIARAGVVVGGAGDGLVSQVLAARRPFVCLPEPRPFGEQVSKARALDRLRRVVVAESWPQAEEWTGLLNRAAALPAALDCDLHDPNGPARAARVILDAAAAAAPLAFRCAL